MSPIIDLMKQRELFLSLELGNPVRIWKATLIRAVNFLPELATFDPSCWAQLATFRLACSVGHEAFWLFFL